MHEETLADVISLPFGLELGEKEVIRQAVSNAEKWHKQAVLAVLSDLEQVNNIPGTSGQANYSEVIANKIQEIRLRYEV